MRNIMLRTTENNSLRKILRILCMVQELVDSELLRIDYFMGVEYSTYFNLIFNGFTVCCDYDVVCHPCNYRYHAWSEKSCAALISRHSRCNRK